MSEVLSVYYAPAHDDEMLNVRVRMLRGVRSVSEWDGLSRFFQETVPDLIESMKNSAVVFVCFLRKTKLPACGREFC